MPREVLERVGEPFFTTKPPGRGMGLGLFLARSVVERVGGSLRLDSNVGRGTTAIVRGAAAGAARVNAARPPLLLVDDDEVFRERLGRALRDRGYDVATAPADATAMAAARARVAGVRGRRSQDARASQGSSWSRQLHELDAQTRIVVLTGYGSIASAVDALRLGAHDYLSKPADADEIIAALRGHKAPARIEPGRARRRSAAQLARAEWEHISRILADAGGNVSEAARRLGITRRTLQLKLKKDPPRH